MDMVRSEVGKLAAEDYSTAQHLAHASQQARERNYQDFLIVDVDAHHYESESYKDVFEYIESPVIRRQAVESAKRGGRASMLGGQIGYQDIGGGIPPPSIQPDVNLPPPKHTITNPTDPLTLVPTNDAIGRGVESPLPTTSCCSSLA